MLHKFTFLEVSEKWSIEHLFISSISKSMGYDQHRPIERKYVFITSQLVRRWANPIHMSSYLAYETHSFLWPYISPWLYVVNKLVCIYIYILPDFPESHTKDGLQTNDYLNWKMLMMASLKSLSPESSDRICRHNQQG